MSPDVSFRHTIVGNHFDTLSYGTARLTSAGQCATF